MLDLGHEYALIDNDPAKSEQEKLQAKIQLREEDSKRKERSHNIRQMLRAHLLMEKDSDYIVQDNKIIIIDEMPKNALQKILKKDLRQRP